MIKFYCDTCSKELDYKGGRDILKINVKTAENSFDGESVLLCNNECAMNYFALRMVKKEEEGK